MSDSINGKMKCLGCKKDKLPSEMSQTGISKNVLCLKCHGAPVYTHARSRKPKSSNWLEDLIDGLGSIFD